MDKREARGSGPDTQNKGATHIRRPPKRERWGSGSSPISHTSRASISTNTVSLLGFHFGRQLFVSYCNHAGKFKDYGGITPQPCLQTFPVSETSTFRGGSDKRPTPFDRGCICNSIALCNVNKPYLHNTLSSALREPNVRAHETHN